SSRKARAATTRSERPRAERTSRFDKRRSWTASQKWPACRGILLAARDGHLLLAETKRAMSQDSMVIKEGVRIVRGTPNAPQEAPAQYLEFTIVSVAGKPRHREASLATARPGPQDYVYKNLFEDMEYEQKEALAKAIAIAKRGGIEEIYVNADLAKL